MVDTCFVVNRLQLYTNDVSFTYRNEKLPEILN